MAEFRMPSLGSDMQEGTLIEWRVKPGDRVRRGDILAVVDTDKAAIEIEAFDDGIIETLLVQPGQKVPVGTVMAVIRGEGIEVPSRAITEAAAEEKPIPVAAVRVPAGLEGIHPLEKGLTVSPLGAEGAQRVKASPYARKLAAEHSVDLTLLQGSGPHGSIRAADVQRVGAMSGAAAPKETLMEPEERKSPAEVKEAAQPTPPVPEKPAPSNFQAAMRRAIAAAMSRSNREIPHYYLQTRIDMSRTLSWLEAENLDRSIKQRILPVVPLIRAVALALQEVPELNGYWLEDRHQPQEAIHIGFAISLRQGGLIAPAILNADLMSMDELMEALRDLITRARIGRLRGSEMTDPTITMTSLGDLGVETVYGVIYPPQVALVGFGKTMEQPWAENGMLGVRPVLTATLAADHRATDGRRGAQFLDALNRTLQEPTKL